MPFDGFKTFSLFFKKFILMCLDDNFFLFTLLCICVLPFSENPFPLLTLLCILLF